jgi:hypothetical protein
MKRNFLKLAAGAQLSKKEFREMLLSAMRVNYDSRIMYRYLREHAPDLNESEKIALDRECVWMLAERNGIEVYEVPKNKGVLSCLVFDRKENHQAYNTLDYTRQLLRNIGKGKKGKKAEGEKKNSRSTPKAEAARIAKAHADAGYLMSLAQALMAEANKLVAAK